MESHTLRWGPMDDVRHALRWRDSSGDPGRKRARGMWGADRPATEALRLLPTAPVAGGQLATVGFLRAGANAARGLGRCGCPVWRECRPG